MPEECDFSRGVRGKFFRKDAEFNLPEYLDADNLSFVTKIAERKEADISEVVNDLIRSDKRLAGVMEWTSDIGHPVRPQSSFVMRP